MLLKQQMQRSARATLQRQQHQHHTLCNSSAAIAAALLCCPRPNPWLVSPAAPSCLQQQQRQRWSGRCAAVAADKQQQHNAQQQRQAVDSGRICKPSPAPQQHQQQHTRASARQPSSLVVAAAAAAAVLPPPLPPPQPEQQHIISGVPATDAPNLDHHQQQPPVAALQGLPALPPSVLQHSHQQPHRFAHLSSISHVDPSALSITDRVQLLTSNAAARRHCPPKPRASLAGIKVDDVSQFCAAAGVSTAASAVVLQHVKASKLSASPGGLGYFLACYQQLSRMYGEAVVLQWLKKAPPVIRVADEVPGRLAQLQQLLGPSASLPDVLALTKRCPQVLQVSRPLLVTRMHQLCSLLARDPATEASKLLTAAPALLAMHPATLEVKVQQLRALAATHPSWAEAYCSCPPKSLAILLTYSLERQLRLHYAAAFGLQPKIQMSTVMAWSKPKWLEAHPNFDEWCHLYKRQQFAHQAVAQQQQQQQRQEAQAQEQPEQT